MKKIPLTKGFFAIVDEADYVFLSQWKWSYQSFGYALRRIHIIGGKSYTLLMHRQITGVPINMIVDHKNKNKLDNRKGNLRICTQKGNQGNRYINKNNTSGYRGVSWSKAAGKWQAKIRINYKNIYLGLHNSKINAALAYNEAAKKHFGEFANLNVVYVRKVK